MSFGQPYNRENLRLCSFFTLKTKPPPWCAGTHTHLYLCTQKRGKRRFRWERRNHASHTVCGEVCFYFQPPMDGELVLTVHDFTTHVVCRLHLTTGVWQTRTGLSPGHLDEFPGHMSEVIAVPTAISVCKHAHFLRLARGAPVTTPSWPGPSPQTTLCAVCLWVSPGILSMTWGQFTGKRVWWAPVAKNAAPNQHEMSTFFPSKGKELDFELFHQPRYSAV